MFRDQEWQACIHRNVECGKFYFDFFCSARGAIKTAQDREVDIVLALKEFRLLFTQFQGW